MIPYMTLHGSIRLVMKNGQPDRRSVWTAKELETSLSRGLLFKQTTSTETRIKDPNVKGRNITLRALNGSVGTDNGEIVIDGSNPDELKDQQKRIALAAAEADDVAVDSDNKTITVLLRKPVNIAASGSIDVELRTMSMGSGAYLCQDNSDWRIHPHQRCREFILSPHRGQLLSRWSDHPRRAVDGGLGG